MRLHCVLALLFAVLMCSLLVVQVRCRDPCCDIIDAVKEFIETYEDKSLEQALSDAIDLNIEIKKCGLEIAEEFEIILKNIIEMMNGASGFRPMRRIMVKGMNGLRKKRKADNGLTRLKKKMMKATLLFYTHTPDILTLKDMRKMKKALSTTRKYLERIPAMDPAACGEEECPPPRGDYIDPYDSTLDVFNFLNQAAKGNAKATPGLRELAKKTQNIVTPPANEEARVVNAASACPANCGDHGTRVSQGPFFSYCRCDPNWKGTCCDQGRVIHCPPRVVKRQAGCPADCGPHGTRIHMGPFFSFCRCDLMWEGQCCDAVQQFANMVYCNAYGDVHMDSFDKQNIHFQDSCITDMVTSSGFPQFTVSLKGYFTSPTAIYSWIEYLRLVVTDGRGTTTTIVIKRKDAAGHFVEWTDAGSAPYRIATFPYDKPVSYTHVTGRLKTVLFKIYISGANVVVDAASTFAELVNPNAKSIGLRMKSTATGYPSVYIYAADAWKGREDDGLQGMCGDFDGIKALKDDLRGRDGDVVTAVDDNYGTAMSNSWRADDDPTCINNKEDGPWNMWKRKRQTKERNLRKRKAGSYRMELAKLYCRNADCEKQKDTNKWRACSVDASNPMSEDDLCLLLEEQIHSKSRCWKGEFNCPKVIKVSKNQLRKCKRKKKC